MDATVGSKDVLTTTVDIVVDSSENEDYQLLFNQYKEAQVQII